MTTAAAAAATCCAAASFTERVVSCGITSVCSLFLPPCHSHDPSPLPLESSHAIVLAIRLVARCV